MSILIRRGALRSLLEAAVSPSEASESGIAVIVSKMGGDRSVVAYDVDGLLQRALDGVKNGDDPVDSLEKNCTGAIIGIVSLRPSESMNVGPCNGAYVILASAAKSGYGPLVYDLALSLGRPVAPDRTAVSSAAAGVWAKYAARSDVQKKKLDNIDDPKTPDTSDDCRLHTSDESGHLNATYEASSAGSYARMFQMNKSAWGRYLKALKEMRKDPISFNYWNGSITLAAADYFSIKYAKDVLHK